MIELWEAFKAGYAASVYVVGFVAGLFLWILVLGVVGYAAERIGRFMDRH